MKDHWRKEDIYTILINKSLEPYGVDKEYVLKNPTIEGEPWYRHYKLPRDKAEDFRDWGIKAIKKNERCSLKVATHIFSWYDLMYGLSLEEANTYLCSEKTENEIQSKV